MKTADIRRSFIEFFKKHNHTYVPSSPTIPTDDPTILFTVAGMAQFKACFTGQKKCEYLRAVNSQKCIRVADLDDVGKDGRHLTMFEMLGSWSFGDYYKKEAINWAYEFVVNHLKLDLNRIWISVHRTDDESAEIWKNQGIVPERIVRLDDKDNFWAMGPTGPCGPCSEMYYDQGADVGSCAQANIACKGPGCECDRFLEFWNLVFMQFQRDENGTLHELPLKSVDTGMGLERISALLQNKTNVFEIDAFVQILNQISKVANLAIPFPQLTPEQKECFHVIADHMRFLCFTIADGVNFSNEGRGYVLRRVLRRATRYLHKLCPSWPKNQSFLKNIVDVVVSQNSEFFPELTQSKSRIQQLIETEEIKFNKTLESGLQKFNEFLNQSKSENTHILSGKNVFVLHDTFGFPADLTKILCNENHFEIDVQGYEKCMLEQQEQSRADAKFYKLSDDSSPWIILNDENQKEDSNFEGYFIKTNYTKNSVNYFQKKFLFNDIKKIRQLHNHTFELVIANTPFYPEGGGQISDQGFIEVVDGRNSFKFDVIDVKKTPAYISHILHHEDWSNQQSEKLNENDLKNIFHSSVQLYTYVNLSYRTDIARHHTATHILHKSLQAILGEQVRQAGSLVKNDMLRFDFSHQNALTDHQIKLVENLANAEILKNHLVYTHQNMPLQEAQKIGAMAMFGEKYDSHVRVLQINDFSLELCGGTHVDHTAEIGQIKILSESGVTNGVRRIEAVAGYYALEHSRTLEDTLNQSADLLKCAQADLPKKIQQTKDQIKEFEKHILDLEGKIANLHLHSLIAQAQSKDDLKVISAFVPNVSLKTLEMLCDQIKSKPHHIAILATMLNDKTHVIAGMHQQILKTHKDIHLGKVVLSICEKINGKGGGRPDFARGSGETSADINAILNSVF